MKTQAQKTPLSEKLPSTKSLSWFAAGFFFALLWGSASTATKIGLTVAQPLVIAVVRFGMAAVPLLVVAHLVLRYRFPKGSEWKSLAIYGLLNITVYLGLYVVGMQTVTAGVGALAVASNPVFIGFLSVFVLKKRLAWPVVLAIIISALGVLCAAWPLLGTAAVDAKGLLILLASMLSYSAGAIYFAAKNWKGLPLLVINGWQTLLGGIFLLPFAIFFYRPDANHFNVTYWLSVGWLAIPVSILAVQLWLWLLQKNAVKAGLWLFLCPLFGFVLAALVLHDSITVYTLAGILLVMGGLLLSKTNAGKNETTTD
ncbi:MAG TPA: EamA family transporter [Flavisolibacter sp.]|nr:EamA family transporter [Flavisolibacter sp.]